jgi:hypothetical protein
MRLMCPLRTCHQARNNATTNNRRGAVSRRAAHLSASGATHSAVPNLQRLAADAVEHREEARLERVLKHALRRAQREGVSGTPRQARTTHNARTHARTHAHSHAHKHRTHGEGKMASSQRTRAPWKKKLVARARKISFFLHAPARCSRGFRLPAAVGSLLPAGPRPRPATHAKKYFVPEVRSRLRVWRSSPRPPPKIESAPRGEMAAAAAAAAVSGSASAEGTSGQTFAMHNVRRPGLLYTLVIMSIDPHNPARRRIRRRCRGSSWRRRAATAARGRTWRLS